MRAYLSGWQATNYEREMAVIKTGHMKYRCFSYAMVVKLRGMSSYVPGMKHALRACLENNVGIMMDSGVFSYRTHVLKLQQARKPLDKLVSEEEFIESYVKYCKKNHKSWDFYLTVDLAVNATDIFKRHCVLEQMGIHPVPAFHGDKSIEYIKRYADKGYKLIAFGSPKWLRSGHDRHRRYLAAAFNEAEKYKMKVHGLAMTSPWQMIEFPFWSVDSSSWSRVASQGCLMNFDERSCRLSTIHISDRAANGKVSVNTNSNVMAHIKEVVESKGYNFEQLRTDFIPRHQWNAHTMLHLAEFASKRQRTGFNLLF